MKEIIKATILLTVICMISAGLLAWVYGVTKPRIEMEKIKRLEEGVRELFPESNQIKEKNGIFWAYDQENKIIGKIVKTTFRGYAGPITLLVGLEKDKVRKIKVMEQSETPGLGDGIIKDSFRSQFNGKVEKELKLKKDGGTIEAISGATISSRAVVEGIRKEFVDTVTGATASYKKMVEEGKQK